jgi:hypothetical protein
MILPNGRLFQEHDIASVMMGVSRLLSKATNQKFLSTWHRTASPARRELQRLCEAYLSPVQFSGTHKPFDLPHKLVIGHQPNAFLKTFLPRQEESMPQHQFGIYLKLLLGLSIPGLSLSSPVCPCGLQHDFHGYLRLSCKQNVCRANQAAHDLVQRALKYEFQSLNLSVVDNDYDMRQRFAHLSSQKRGDLAILSTSPYLIYDQVSRQPRSQAIADIKMVSLVNSESLGTAISRFKNKVENPTLVQQEKIKDSKHAYFYASIGLLSLLSLLPVLDLMGLLQSGVCSALLILNCVSTIPASLVRAFLHCWILLPGHSFRPSPTVKSRLALNMLLPRLLLCVFLEFHALHCHCFLLVLAGAGKIFPSFPTFPAFFSLYRTLGTLPRDLSVPPDVLLFLGTYTRPPSDKVRRGT